MQLGELSSYSRANNFPLSVRIGPSNPYNYNIGASSAERERERREFRELCSLLAYYSKSVLLKTLSGVRIVIQLTAKLFFRATS